MGHGTVAVSLAGVSRAQQFLGAHTRRTRRRRQPKFATQGPTMVVMAMVLAMAMTAATKRMLMTPCRP